MESKYDSFMKLVPDLSTAISNMEKASDRNVVEEQAKKAKIAIDAMSIKMPYLYKEINDKATERSSQIIVGDTYNALGD